MHKELDRIERNTTKVADHPKMSQSTVSELKSDVKVGSGGWGFRMPHPLEA